MRKILIILFLQLSFSSSFAEILIFKNCSSEDYEFEKNDYNIDIEKGIMVREFVYTDETFERLRMTDVRTKRRIFQQKRFQK